ncbi:hypothetical protein [uncultured Desulfovibrio sp.]|uniref:hypothetical protein n=1 Tax=uncultured Desulfovibrio sp. TaxID=167968 RepID=UPI00260E4CEC|nr:hypothetical protein [uncultured Desulfovibrio sp.]
MGNVIGSLSTPLPSQVIAEHQKIVALQAQLDQATTKIAELKAEMEKYGEELFHTTQTVLDAINQQQQKASQQAAEDYAKAKQSMLEELTAAQKKAFVQLEEANSRFEAAKKRFDTELETWQKQSSELLQKTEQAFSSQNSKQEQAYTELHEKLSSLLPEASAVGIAAAFADEKKSRQNAMWINLLTSYFCIFAIFLIAIFFYQENKDTLSSIIYARNNASEYFVFFITFAKLLTLEAPFCWLATFMAKKAHQHQRIYEEYAHKYTAAMTYVGLCKETRDYPNLYGKDAISTLTNGFRDAVFFNPSAAIDKKVEMDSPMALVDRLIEKVGQPVAEAIVSSKKQR